jgi:hypothetical protein
MELHRKISGRLGKHPKAFRELKQKSVAADLLKTAAAATTYGVGKGTAS